MGKSGNPWLAILTGCIAGGVEATGRLANGEHQDPTPVIISIMGKSVHQDPTPVISSIMGKSGNPWLVGHSDWLYCWRRGSDGPFGQWSTPVHQDPTPAATGAKLPYTGMISGLSHTVKTTGVLEGTVLEGTSAGCLSTLGIGCLSTLGIGVLYKRSSHICVM